MPRNTDLDILRLFPWPPKLKINVIKGQAGQERDMCFNRYLDLLDGYFQEHDAFPKHTAELNTAKLTHQDMWEWGKAWAYMVYAMRLLGWMDADGVIHYPGGGTYDPRAGDDC